MLDGLALTFVEHLSLVDYAVDGGEEVIFSAMSTRYPEREPHDPVAEVLEEVFEVGIERGEKTLSYTGRIHQLFVRAEREGINLPDEARGY